MSDHRIEIDDDSPYLVGRDFTIGPKATLEDLGVVVPEPPEDLRAQWSTDPGPRWEITIGETGGAQ